MEYPKIETLYERDPATFKVKAGMFKNKAYSLIKTFHWTEKVDGTNIRCKWDAINKKVSFGGRTDNAQIHGDLLKWLYENVSVAKLTEVFPDVDVVLYGEGYGAGIQKGVHYCPEKKFIMFDVLVEGKWWLTFENVVDIGKKLGLDVVPSFGEMTLEDATAVVREGVTSFLSPNMKAEGLVGRPAETLFDSRGNRLIVKLKTKDF